VSAALRAIVVNSIINPFTAEVANNRLLGRPPKSLFGTVAKKRTLMNLLLIKIALLTWGVYDAHRRTAHSKTHQKN
jgi:hypothetical protein